MGMERWRVMPIPEGDKNALMTLAPGATAEETQKVAENVGGVTIYIGQGASRRQEFCRVGYIRRATKNPNTPFKQEFEKQLAAADAVVVQVNNRLTTELPAIESKITDLTNKLRADAQKLTDQAEALSADVTKQVAALGERIDKLAGEIIEKVSTPEGLL